VTAKPPTPQGISRLLKSAGFTRCAPADQVGINHATSGYRVSADLRRNDAVRVVYYSPPAEVPPGNTRLDFLAAYTKTITEAGWTVETGEYELTVTAGKDEQR